MTRLLKDRVQKDVAALLLTLMLTEMFLPFHLMAKAALNAPLPHRSSATSYSFPGANERSRRAPGNVSALPKPASVAVPDAVTKEMVVQKNKTPLKVSIGGPGQPEMSSFKSVNADNAVDLFTGDFS